MDRRYNLRLDLQFRCNNSTMQFDEFDNNTSDFFVRVTRAGELIDLTRAIVTLVVIKPDKSVDAQFVEIRSNKIYCDLKQSMKNLVGDYEAIASIVINGEMANTDPIFYNVNENKFLRQLNQAVVTEERFTILTDMINRLSSIENSEAYRVTNEEERVKKEKLREEAIVQVKKDIEKIITDTKKDIADYKTSKDTEINKDLGQYKDNKDLEINNLLNEYKTNTTKDITEFKDTKSKELDDFKNTKNSEIDDYKREKDLAINKYVSNKNLELDKYVLDKNSEIDRYKEAKDTEIDLYKSNKDTLINNKIIEVEAAKQNIVSAANAKISELDQAKTNMQNDVNAKIEEADNRISELRNFESQIEQIESKNTEQDTRLKDIEYKNKVQDVYVNGLFNENADGRLTIEGEGTSLKLEGSKKGLAEVKKVVGSTVVNLAPVGVALCNDTSAFTHNYQYIDMTQHSNCIEFTASKGGYLIAGYDNRDNNMLKNKAKYLCMADVEVVKITGTEIYATPPNGILKSRKSLQNGRGIVANVFEASDGDITSGNSGWISVRTNTDNEQVGSSFKLYGITVLELSNADYEKPIDELIDKHWSYFEGMKSSFDDVNEEGKYPVDVVLRGKNLFNPSIDFHNSTSLYGGYLVNPNGIDVTLSIKDKNTNVNVDDIYFGFTEIGIGGSGEIKWIKTPTYIVPKMVSNLKYISIYPNTKDAIDRLNARYDIQLEIGKVATQYEPYYEKHTTVYLNSPLLNGDEIVYEDGELRHWHNSGKVVLDGSEEWIVDNQGGGENSFGIKLNISGGITVSEGFVLQFNPAIANKLFNDKFPHIFSYELSKFSFNYGWGSYVFLKFTNIEVPSLNLEGCKIWLQNNNTTFVYPLSEPYYESISADKLILECANDSTLHIDTVIPVESIVSYTGNVPSVYGLQKTNETQDNLIDVTLCATDEMFMMIEPLLNAMPQNERMVSKMVDMYVAMVIRGLKDIEDVPERYREQVKEILNKLEK